MKTPRPVWLTDEEARALRDFLAMTAETAEPGPLREAAHAAISSLCVESYVAWWRQAAEVLQAVGPAWDMRLNHFSMKRAMAMMDPTVEEPEGAPEAGLASIAMTWGIARKASELLAKIRG